MEESNLQAAPTPADAPPTHGAELKAYMAGTGPCPAWVDPVLAVAFRVIKDDETVRGAVQLPKVSDMRDTAQDGGQLARALALLDLCVRGWLPLWLGQAGCVQAREALRAARPLTPEVLAQGGGGMNWALDVAWKQARELPRPRGRIALLDADPLRDADSFKVHPIGAQCASAWRTLLVLPEISSEEAPATAAIARALAARVAPMALDIAIRCVTAAELERRPGVSDWTPLYTAYARAAAPVIGSLPAIGRPAS